MNPICLAQLVFSLLEGDSRKKGLEIVFFYVGSIEITSLKKKDEGGFQYFRIFCLELRLRCLGHKLAI